MAAAKLQQVRARNILKTTVPMIHHDIIRFGEDGMWCIATVDLNACHAVIIVSKKAAILTHIAPLPPEAIRDKYPTSEDWIKDMMTRVISCFIANKQYFEHQGLGGIVIYGVYNKEIALADQVKLLAATVQKIVGSNTRPVAYNVIGSSEPRNADKGIVLVDGSQPAQPPVIWVEDKRYTLATPESKTVASASTSSQSK